ncbi:MAG: hypothetical protein FJX00_03315 [Alphaproteobacteria bacterium]|nr:hypothetical protein [Alphaproteobacteria bacterium]
MSDLQQEEEKIREATYVIDCLTRDDYCSIGPSQYLINCFFKKLIRAYTENNWYRAELSDSDRSLHDITYHLISRHCNRNPDLSTVRDCIKALNRCELNYVSNLKDTLTIYLQHNEGSEVKESEFFQHFAPNEQSKTFWMMVNHIKHLPPKVIIKYLKKKISREMWNAACDTVLASNAGHIRTEMIKELTKKIAPEMWGSVLNNVMDAAQKGSKNDLVIVKYLAIKEWYSEIAAMNAKEHLEKEIKLEDSVQVRDKIFEAKADQYLQSVKNMNEGRVSDLQQQEEEKIRDYDSFFKDLTRPGLTVYPSQNVINSFFTKLIKTYTELIKTYTEALTGQYAFDKTDYTETDYREVLSTIKYFISGDCNRKPEPDTVRDCITVLDKFEQIRTDVLKTKTEKTKEIWRDAYQNQKPNSADLKKMIQGLNNEYKNPAILNLKKTLTIYPSEGSEVKDSELFQQNNIKHLPPKVVTKDLPKKISREMWNAACDTVVTSNAGHMRMKIIKELTKKIAPKMWGSVLNKAVDAALNGSENDLDIVKYLISTDCHTEPDDIAYKAKMMGLFLEMVMDSTTSVSELGSMNEGGQGRIKNLRNSLLKYLTSPECAVRPSQEVIDKLFTSKAVQYLQSVKNMNKAKDSSLQQAEKKKIKDYDSVLKHLTRQDFAVYPSQSVIDSFFTKLIKTYTEALTGQYAFDKTDYTDILSTIKYLTSGSCKRNPEPGTVSKCINMLSDCIKSSDEFEPIRKSFEKENDNTNNIYTESNAFEKYAKTVLEREIKRLENDVVQEQTGNTNKNNIECSLFKINVNKALLQLFDLKDTLETQLTNFTNINITRVTNINPQD